LYARAELRKGQIDEGPAVEGSEPAANQKELESLLEQVAEKYADVVAYENVTLGDRARGDLFEIRFLAIGKVAPEIVGKDADGKDLKLGDFKGKVVVLDFWGNW
jgi:thiol-disulfide isomerase/thioredoxin